MRQVLAILLLWTTHSLAEQPVLRFSIAESWSMPLMRTEQEQPVEGILFELMQAIARETGTRAQYHVMARLRLQEALENGDIDVRCYVSSQWLDERPGNYLWSVPLIEQRDLLVGRPGDSNPTTPENLAPQSIGTVLGYTYPTLAPLFNRGRLQREDSRNQLLALQKLKAGRYRHAVSNQLSLQWFNRQHPPEQRLRVVAVLQEQALGCLVRNDPLLPTRRVLKAMMRLKQSGEVERIIERYTDASSPQRLTRGDGD
ncbi:MAG: transporter substrate-binding domain-containing protein [Paucimonas sp.]|uniref:substrate-binding periplasmic protein n=1 Tax=Pantoea sp. Cy-639 TaxID=2608360 RepID=UPI0014224F26|nr:transporter substrate-binding domain-containing protein [Paucimonas sp.]NIF18613.1 transporter substrate-binding domain-containing protein [Pantoea sp. Cy-639]